MRLMDEIERLKAHLFEGHGLHIEGNPWSLGGRYELQWRLNERLQGRNPGQPVNWKGLS